MKTRPYALMAAAILCLIGRRLRLQRLLEAVNILANARGNSMAFNQPIMNYLEALRAPSQKLWPLLSNYVTISTIMALVIYTFPSWAGTSATPAYRDPILPKLAIQQASTPNCMYSGPTYDGYVCTPTGEASVTYTVTGTGCVFTGQFVWGDGIVNSYSWSSEFTAFHQYAKHGRLPSNRIWQRHTIGPVSDLHLYTCKIRIRGARTQQSTSRVLFIYNRR
jgi:hypothetical protein